MNVENEEYLENLDIKIDVYITFLKGIYDVMQNYEYETCYQIQYEEILNNKDNYDSLINEIQTVVDYYMQKNQYNKYIAILCCHISEMNFYYDECILINKLNNKIQKYYEILLENKVPFNRATIPCILLYADNPNENSLLEKLKENIKVKPITTEEKYTINQFGEDEDYIWKYVGLKK